MDLRYFARRGLAAGALLTSLALAGCGDDPDLIIPDPNQHAEAGAMFDRYVAIGNSITAGYQSGGINDSTQQESYAALLAQQLGTDYRYAALAMPGCQPPIANPLTGARIGPAGCNLLVEPAGGVLNNVAIPGAASEDPTTLSTIASNTITTLILNGKTQVQRALDADPTFVSIWIGNNDVLEAAASGMLTPTAGVSRGVTDTSTFKQNYRAMLTQLRTGEPELQGVLVGVVNTAAIPLLFPVSIIVDNVAARTAFAQATGGQTAADITILPNCTTTTGREYYVSFAIAPRIAAYRANASAPGAHPPVISCGPSGVATIPAPIGDIFMLSPTEQQTLATVVGAYNTFIRARADSLGWAYADVNQALLAIKAADVAAANPRITTFPRLDLALQTPPKSPYGTFFSFDGFHPALPAHVEVANIIIAAINAKYGTTIAPCVVPTTQMDPPVCQ